LNIQELQTVARNQLPLKIVILNNRSHGMVRQFQESYFEGRYASTFWGYSAPDFVAVAAAFGIDAGRVDDEADLDEAIRAMWSSRGAPYLLEVAIDTAANAYPKIAFGHPISEMEPFVAPKAMEST
jgi:acetolactate synthase-1/2/3 large subunit